MSNPRDNAAASTKKTADEVRQLRAVIRDLGACLSLPALWSGREPASIAEGLLDVLVSVLRLDIAYIRLNDPDTNASHEVVRPNVGLLPGQVGKLLQARIFPQDFAAVPRSVPNFLGDGALQVARFPLGVNEEGIVAVAAGRADFPTEVDSFLLRAVLNQAVLSLRAARNVAQIESVASENARLYQQSLENQRALQQSEERFRTLVEQVKDYAIFRTDKEGRATSWNEGVRHVLGFEEAEFLGADTTSAIFTPEDIQAGVPQEELRTAAAEGSASNDRWMRRKDGTRFYAGGMTTALHDAAGELIGFTKVMRDLTESKRAEEALREADRRKDEFIAMLGHELRNPLGIISNAVQILRRIGRPETNLHDLYEMIERQVTHTSRMLEDLLDVSRISRGKIQLNKQPWDLRDIVRQTAEDYQSALNENGLKLELNVAEQPLRIIADRTRLAQAVGNLLHNACKFTLPGGTVWVIVEAEEQARALLGVRDNGIGMEPEELGWVFEPFSQAERSLDRSRGGLGLGLALVKGIVELHGGEATAASGGPGRGSEFTIRLPLDQSHAKLPTAKPANADRISRRILVIEDNPVGARSLRMLLEHMGHTVELAHNGQDGIEAAGRFRPEVVLCDIGLPGLDGYGVARALRREVGLDRALLIAVSGYAQDKERAREAGFNAHLLKPVNFEKLEQMLTILAQPST